MMGWNLFAPMNNTMISFVSNLTHAAGGEDFTIDQYLKAKRIMLNSVGSAISLDLLQTRTANKTRALMDRYNVLGEINQVAYESYVANSKVSKGLQKLSPFELTKRAEYLNQGTTFIALMLNTKVKDKEGKEHSLYEAYDENGKWKTEQFGEHKEWEGELNDPTANKKRHAFKAKLDQIKKQIHGNYDPDSATRISKGMIGRSVMLFRRWIAEGVANRFEKEKYDDILERTRKGRYITWNALTGGELGRLTGVSLLLKQMLNFMTFNGVMKTSLDQLNAVDKANMRKNAMEMIIYGNLFLLALALKSIDSDDDKEKAALNYLFNVGFRVQQDMEFFVNPMSFQAITRSTVPAFQTIADFAIFFDAVQKAMVGKDELKSGPFQGESRVLVKGAKIFPGVSQPIKFISGVSQKLNEEYRPNK